LTNISGKVSRRLGKARRGIAQQEVGPVLFEVDVIQRIAIRIRGQIRVVEFVGTGVITGRVFLLLIVNVGKAVLGGMLPNRQVEL
jgi:hypothetical protein